MTCPHRLHDGPLTCTRPVGHTGAHVYVASDCQDRHALTEPNGREA
jgi:hypothetical protein